MSFPLRAIIFTVVIFLIIGSIFFLEKERPERSGILGGEISPASNPAFLNKVDLYPPAVEITTPDGFINTDNIAISELIGKKVILVDFWTYSCINCQRTIPYLNSWHKKYGDKGLVIIGIHTPEFEFEKKYENVLAAVDKFGIEYPVVLDNDYSTWSGYRNQYWPRKYLIDIDGFIVYDHIGEGAYEETEMKIQKALMERAGLLGAGDGMAGDLAATTIEKERFYSLLNSPEVYFGAFRNELFGNGLRQVIGNQKLNIPDKISPNTLYLSGDWNIEREYAENVSAGARIIFKYRAKDVYMVASGDESVKIKVFRDGKAPGDAAGEDIDEDGRGTINSDNLYKLIQDDGEQGEHVIEIQIEDPGLKAFTFTFG